MLLGVGMASAMFFEAKNRALLVVEVIAWRSAPQSWP